MVKENNCDDGDVELFQKIIGIASLLKRESLTSHRSENWPSSRSKSTQSLGALPSLFHSSFILQQAFLSRSDEHWSSSLSSSPCNHHHHPSAALPFTGRWVLRQNWPQPQLCNQSLKTRDASNRRWPTHDSPKKLEKSRLILFTQLRWTCTTKTSYSTCCVIKSKTSSTIWPCNLHNTTFAYALTESSVFLPDIKTIYSNSTQS